MNRKYLKHIARDFLILFVSIAVAVMLVRFGLIEQFVAATALAPEMAGFIAGMFFTSVFTIAPAGAALIGLSSDMPAYELALFGGAGAALVDLIIFGFLRDNVSRDMRKMLSAKWRRRLFSLSHFGFLKWVIAGLGGAVIASPFPDEIGLAILTFAKLRPQQMLLLTFTMNALGIFALVSVARALS